MDAANRAGLARLLYYKVIFLSGAFGDGSFASGVIFSLFGGVFADRFNKRNLLIATQASSIIPAIVLALLTGFHCLNVWAILCVAAFLGTVNSSTSLSGNPI